jgi:ABC-type branched-subunit amino acid transport system substrate-binding protein
MSGPGLLGAIATALLWLLAAMPVRADAPLFKIAVQTSLTGISGLAGNAFADAIRFAVDEGNAASGQPRFEIEVFDDASTEAGSRAAAQRIVASDAAIVLGPARTPLAITACRTYGEAGLPIIATTLHADELTQNPTTFRTVISTGEIGEALADYLGRILHARRAVVFSIDNGYGRPLAARFAASASRQGIDASFRSFTTTAERDAVTRDLATQQDQGPIILGMEYEDAVPVLMALRREGYHGLVMGTATMARETFAAAFANAPEDRRQPGYFTEATYAASPMILDSANAEILAFAGRYEARFGREPSWEAVQAYDGALLAMAALRQALAAHPDLAAQDVHARRKAVLDAVAWFDAPAKAVAGLNGPIWFAPDRVRRQPVRIGRFHDGVFESAPLQLVPVADPDPDELASGAVFATEPGQFYRLQRVVQTGTFLNLIPHVNVAKSSFGADFYLWLRYARDAGPGAADPVDIGFPGMVSGTFNPAAPAEATEMADGTDYRLWRIQGEFRNDYDLHSFPFDRQDLQIRLSNARASSDRIVYVLDRRASRRRPASAAPVAPPSLPGIAEAHAAAPGEASASRADTSLVAPDAFAELTQWQPVGAFERRDTLVTPSALGDLRRVGLKTPRELSGFLVTFRLQRRITAALIKMMLPVFLMTVVMYTTLHFPHALTKEKVTVQVTSVLSGAVLLSAVNSQLGAVGYTILAEYAFYGFFALGLLCVAVVMAFETLRLGGREAAAARVELTARGVFILSIVLIAALGVWMYVTIDAPTA